MGKSRTIRVIPVALASWRSAFAAFRHMKALFTIVTLILIGAVFAGAKLKAEFVESDFLEPFYLLLPVVVVLSAVVQALILVPLAIAVHRFVLLGEIASQGSLLGDINRYGRFAVYAAALMFILNLPVVQVGLEWSITQGRDELRPRFFTIMQFVVPLVMLAVLLNTLILFPAIAVDAAGAGIRNAFSDSWLHLWRILGVVLCTIIPLLAVLIALRELDPLVLQWSQAQFIMVVVKVIIRVIAAAVLAAAASYIFLCYGRRVGTPPVLPGKTPALI